jgi:hypothetical protein
MITDIDRIISLMKEYTTNSNEELGEQEEAPTGGDSSGGGSTNTVTKWETGLVRGKANRLGLKGEKWESGLTRGKANPLN